MQISNHEVHKKVGMNVDFGDDGLNLILNRTISECPVLLKRLDYGKTLFSFIRLASFI